MTADGLPAQVESLTQHAYWRVTMRPDIYSKTRIADAPTCLDVLESIAVRAGGWRYPYVSRSRDRLSIGTDYAQSWVSSGEYLEFARLYESGQFVYATALRESFLSPDSTQMEEARRLARFNNISQADRPTSVVNIVRLMRLVSVAFVNVQHLLDALEYVGDVKVYLRLANVQGAVLVAGNKRELDEYFQAKDSVLDYEINASSAELQTKPEEYGLLAARHFFARFQWLDPSPFVLNGLQEEALT